MDSSLSCYKLGMVSTQNRIIKSWSTLSIVRAYDALQYILFSYPVSLAKDIYRDNRLLTQLEIKDTTKDVD